MTSSARITLFAILFALAIGVSDSAAQFVLQRVTFPNGAALDLADYPTVRARVRATEAGQPVSLPAGSIFLIQGNSVIAPTAVTEQSDGVHVVEWVTSQFGFLLADVIAAYNGGTGTVSYSQSLSKDKGARVVVRDSLSRNVPFYVDFGTVAPGASDTMKLKVVATEAALENGEERLIDLESVTVDNPAFKVIWKGSFGSGPLPIKALSPLEYRIDLVCEPTSDEALSGVLTVRFEGGMRTDVMISANPQSYPQRTILNLVSPNGGEALAPCQEIPITWTGAISGFSSFVEYSTDNGRTWSFIDSTLDSTLIWKVPSTFSDSARVRVYQKFQSSQPVWLDGPFAPATNAAYSADGRYLLVAYRNGTINEWDVATVRQVGSYTVQGGLGSEVTALAYLGRSRDFVAAVGRPDVRGGQIQRFTQGTASPGVTTSIDNDVIVRNVGTDANGTTLYLLTQQTARIPRLDPATLAQRAPITLNAPIGSSSINANTIGASLINGEVVTIDATTGAEIDRSQTGILNAQGPYAHRFATSINGRLVAIAGKQLTSIANGAREQRTFIFDTQTDRIVKILYRETSESVNLSFSPSDAFLGLGFEFSPQFVVYDLVNAQTLPPSGSAEGHKNRLTDLEFSPDGSTLVSTSIDSTRNALLRRVSSPESDMSDGVFSIAPVQLSFAVVEIEPQLIGTRRNVILTSEICNTGSVPAIVDRAIFQSGAWLTFGVPVVGDTINPGECLRLELTCIPLDTGRLVDTLNLEFCGALTRVPFAITSIDRDVSLLVDFEDFGDVCLGQSATRTLAMLRNNDTVDLVINSVYVEGGLQAQFRVVDAIDDLVIPPGGTLQVEVQFNPRDLGYDTASVIIRYADQRVLVRTVHVTGRGSGADLQLSHMALPFMPEIPVRELMIRNVSENPVTITAADITAGEPFTVLTPLPITIGPLDSAIVEVQYSGGAVGSSTFLEFTVEPCAAATRVRLAAYASVASIQLPTVEADPRSDTTSIPIRVTLTENVPYNGTRFFEGAMAVNPRLFLAREITSTIGTGEILSQEIVNDLRIIRFRIEGRFSNNTEIGRIIGYAGMAEVDETPLVFQAGEEAFGSVVDVSYVDGLLRIIHEDPTRRIVDRPVAPIVQQISPNPATDVAEVVLHSNEATTATLRVIDAQGIDLIAPITFDVVKGATALPIDVSSLPVGAHRVVITTEHGVTHASLVIIR